MQAKNEAFVPPLQKILTQHRKLSKIAKWKPPSRQRITHCALLKHVGHGVHHDCAGIVANLVVAPFSTLLQRSTFELGSRSLWTNILLTNMSTRVSPTIYWQKVGNHGSTEMVLRSLLGPPSASISGTAAHQVHPDLCVGISQAVLGHAVRRPLRGRDRPQELHRRA